MDMDCERDDLLSGYPLDQYPLPIPHCLHIRY
jgi:hypothetical protein